MIHIEKFLQSDSIKNTASVNGKTHAIFLSYRGFDGYPQGKLNTGKENLSIQLAGNFNLPSWDDFMLMSVGQALGDIDLAYSGAQSINNDAAKKQEEASNVLEKNVVTDSKVLFFTYAGLSAYKESVTYCEKIREKYTDAFIVVLTCDCDINRKSLYMSPFIERGIINEVVFTSHCGGQSDMESLIKKVIETF